MNGALVRGAALAATLAVTTGLACQLPALTPKTDCLVEPVPVSELPTDLRTQGTVHVRARETSLSHRIALERQAEVLVLVGFTPFGTRAFTVRQTGGEFEVDDFVGSRMGVDPLWIADALHRTWFVAAPPEPSGAATGRWTWGDEVVREHPAEGGVPRTREFDAGAEIVRVVYDGPTSAEVDHPGCGYHVRLVLEHAIEMEPRSTP